MQISEYLTQVNEKINGVFSETIKNENYLGEVHHMASCLFEFSEFIQDKHEREMLTIVSAQLESGLISLTLGLYRQAFSSLRLAFEMGLGTIYFSIYKMEHLEWIAGKTDIKWAKLINTDNGVISVRFSEAFFPELKEQMGDVNAKAANIYRKLSEFVHGNRETWAHSRISIKFDQDLATQYFSFFKTVNEVILFTLCCRYLKSFNSDQLDSLEFVQTQLGHIPAIREFLGGPKEI